MAQGLGMIHPLLYENYYSIWCKKNREGEVYFNRVSVIEAD